MTDTNESEELRTPVLIVGGLGTAAAGLNAFLPRFAVENLDEMRAEAGEWPGRSWDER